MAAVAQTEVSIVEKPDSAYAQELAEAVVAVNTAHGSTLNNLVDLFSHLNLAHWAAYADTAKLPHPSSELAFEAMKIIMRKANYWGGYARFRDQQ